MKVFFDHQCYWERFGGVSRYFTEILKTNDENAEYELALKYSNNEYLNELLYTYKHFLKNWSLPKKQYLISLANKPYSISRLRHSSAKIVHLTHYDPYLFKWSGDKTVVSTMHDMNFFAIPQFYRSHFNVLKSWQTLCAQKSDFIITISENSKRDLMEYLKIPEDRMSVIYHGVSEKFKPTNEKRTVERPYLLFVGRRDGYKNFAVAAKAFSNVKQRYKDLCLVCTGMAFSKKEMELFRELRIENDVVALRASENELVNLYSHAEAFVFPSFYEGFGFPILEAMGCGCPVVCSNASCFPEIAGNAALFFEPAKDEELAEQILALIESDSLRKELITQGLLRKSMFSWEKSRQKHLQVYTELSRR
ncbi:MAG: glycosyltransferase family 4 protein [Treponema sp.]|nr:glycosyltransferase family 4 protein [Treponema sp.]